MTAGGEHVPPAGGAFPSPTILVGVGKFGLAVLEALGEEWHGLADAGSDPTLENLRLLHVRSSDPDPMWRQAETHIAAVATHVGDGDLPSLSLNFVILRALGLIRFRSGAYQLAVPRDAGLAEVDRGIRSGASGQEPPARPVRVRFFEWVSLGPDPVVAVERLRLLGEQDDDVDMFVTPIVQRIRQGQSPRALLSVLGRCRAMGEGRDPSPWPWLAEPLSNSAVTGEIARIEVDPAWRTDEERHLETYLERPLPQASAGDSSHLIIPQLFLPAEGDLPSPIFSAAAAAEDGAPPLLRVDWERTGWAAAPLAGSNDAGEFEPLRASAFRLGLFDYDDCLPTDPPLSGALCERLKDLAVHTHRGLVRLWVDLRRHRVETYHEELRRGEAAASYDDAQRQSLELIGELIVRPVLDSGRRDTTEGSETPVRDDPWVDGSQLPSEPSSVLTSHVVAEHDPRRAQVVRLEQRLAELGVSMENQGLQRNLLVTTSIRARDFASAFGDDDPKDEGSASEEAATLAEFRGELNETVRQMFDLEHLKRYRSKPTRMPPRLTVYVVADFSEPIARSATRPIVRAIHSELLRAYGPIFETNLSGFDRSLSVVPIVWLPHPADAFGGRRALENRREEAVIIEAVHSLRRWIENVPSGKRCVAQMLVNARVTDNAVVGRSDAVRQTRDFVLLESRNEIGADPWLRMLTTGPRGEDFLGSFSCYSISFPAEKVREYLANRLARELLAHIAAGGEEATPPAPPSLSGPDIGDRLAPTEARIGDVLRATADGLCARIGGRVFLDTACSGRSIQDAYNAEFEQDLQAEIKDCWHAMTRDAGLFDDAITKVRSDVSGAVADTRRVAEEHADHLIRTYAVEGRLNVALSGMHRMRAQAFEALQNADSTRRSVVAACVQHGIPDTTSVGAARRAVAAAGAEKPDIDPMRVALGLGLPLMTAAGMTVVYGVMKAMEMELMASRVEVAVRSAAPVLGAALFLTPAVLLLRRTMRRAIDRVSEAISALQGAVRRVVEGPPSGDARRGGPSLRSFFLVRLDMAGALARQSFSAAIYLTAASDARRAGGIRRALKVQGADLRRRVESLGVQPGIGGSDEDDVSRMFESCAGETATLASPREVVDCYEARIARREDLEARVVPFIRTAGGLEGWREIAPFSCQTDVLGFGRDAFHDVTSAPVTHQPAFEKRAGHRLLEFVARLYPNMGFGAKFRGHEGLDPDEVHVIADTSLVLPPDLRWVFDDLRGSPGTPAVARSLSVVDAAALHNRACLLSVVQGMRPAIVRNLQRFESYHDRPLRPDNLTYPEGSDQTLRDPPINHVTGHEELVGQLNGPVLHRADVQSTPSEERRVVRRARREASKISAEFPIAPGAGFVDE